MKQNKFKKIILVLLTMVNIISITYVNSHAALGDIGEPRSSYNLGSARLLEGTNLVIMVFVDTPGCSFTEKDMARYKENLNIACEYLKKQGAMSGKEIAFIGGDSLDTSYRIFLSQTPDESDESVEKLDESIENIKRNIVGRVNAPKSMNCANMSYYGSGIAPMNEHGYDRLKQRYNADNVFMILCFKSLGRSYAICYDGIDSEYETLIMYNDTPSTLAHEILHLYGAHDFYSGAEYTSEVVDYIKKTYPNDIMLSVDKGTDINKSIGELTRYHLGWLDECSCIYTYTELVR